MARGWESKSVEEQQSTRDDTRSSRPALSREDSERLRKRESILLERVRVAHDLEMAQNPRHREIVSQALAHLDQKLAELDRR